jgi:two-component system cell cycle response regulator DivK
MKEEGLLDNKTVLVVDDAPLNRKLIRTILAMRRIRVIEAEDAEQAFKLIREQHPALVLMDLQLPGLNGLEATRAIKSNPDTENIPVLILSAGSVPEDDPQMREAGCAGLILKPFSAEELLNKVSSFLS